MLNKIIKKIMNKENINTEQNEETTNDKEDKENLNNKQNEENLTNKENIRTIEKLLKKIYPYGQILIFVAMACFFALLTYSIKDSLSPIMLFFILLALFIPFWKYSWARIFIGLTLAFFTIWIVQSTGDSLIPFAIAILVAYLSDPFITNLSEKVPAITKGKISEKYSRVATALIISLVFVAILISMLILVVPAIIREVDGVISSIPQYSNTLLDNTIVLLERLETSLKSVLPDTIEIDFVKDKSALTKYLLEEDSFPRQLLPHYSTLQGLNINGLFSALFSYLVIMPLVTFYFMVDIQNIKKGVINLIPKRWQKRAEEITHDTSDVANNYLSGIFKLSTILFIIFFIMLLAARAKYALLLAFIRGLMNIVPFIGPFIAYLIALVVGAATEATWLEGTIKMTVIYGVGQILDTGILQPKIIGREMKMSPIVVLLATIIGGAMFGFVGILVGVPTIAIISLIIKKDSPRYFNSHFYKREDNEDK